MSDITRGRLLPRTVVAGALALGLVAGGYGIASAASGTGAATGSTAATPSTTATTLPALSTTAPTPPQGGNPPQGWGGQRTDETLLTGETLNKVTKAAQARCREARSSASRPTPTATPPTRLT